MANIESPIPADRILEEANLKFSLATKHTQALSNFGITPEWLEQMQSEIDKVMSIPSFDLQKVELKALTAAKDQKLLECAEWGRTLRLRMDLVASDNLLTDADFPSNRWAECEKNESKLITFFPTLIKIAKTHAEVLATVGQTSEYITQGEQLLDELVKANENQEEYNIERKKVTVQRKKAYRSLYDKVNRINKIGQMVFKNDDANQVLFASSWTQDHHSSASHEEEIEEIDPNSETG